MKLRQNQCGDMTVLLRRLFVRSFVRSFVLSSTAAVPAFCIGDYCGVRQRIDLCFALLMVPSARP